MKRAAYASWFACAVLVAGACGGDDEPAATGAPALAPAPTPTPTRTASPTPAPRPEDRPPTLRVARVGAEGPVAVGDTFEAGEIVDTGAQSVSLQFERGARVEVERDARLARSAASATGIALGEGALHALLLPEGGSARPALHVGVPRGTVEIGGSGELFIAALPDGTALVVALQGFGEVRSGALDAEGRLVTTRVVAGHSVVVGTDEATVADGPTSLDDAHRAAARLARSHRGSDATRDAQRTALAEALAARLGEYERESRRGDELRAQHRAAVAAKRDAADRLALQRTIVGHAQALLRARRAVQSTFEQAEALATVGEGGAAWLEPLRASAAPALRIAP